MTKALMTLTEEAVIRVQALMDARATHAAGVRISLKTKGCSGLAYSLEYVDTPRPEDEMVEVQGIHIYIDPKAVMFLIGTEMDYQDDLVKSGFLFRNPNEKGRCGCGESFHV